MLVPISFLMYMSTDLVPGICGYYSSSQCIWVPSSYPLHVVPTSYPMFSDTNLVPYACAYVFRPSHVPNIYSGNEISTILVFIACCYKPRIQCFLALTPFPMPLGTSPARENFLHACSDPKDVPNPEPKPNPNPSNPNTNPNPNRNINPYPNPDTNSWTGTCVEKNFASGRSHSQPSAGQSAMGQICNNPNSTRAQADSLTPGTRFVSREETFQSGSDEWWPALKLPAVTAPRWAVL